MQLYVREIRRFEALWTDVIDEHGQRHGSFLSRDDGLKKRKGSQLDAGRAR